ncbi:membrane bound O-acyl transferase family-domain-containing protein [Zychaea mexicana]|uniref:membrane bound O-acyl transferase family-domain-containing protein n=1 Tax=Zychaea mexicana TaxID=64656 RepID=UPI0022FDCECD|nr:membrane bound O-acyl transferase family-domain-containing protein [Zychaea mexicana]KAI9489437.1 membrane bound O-acyl transferase family-domain-containing protein [Zychaea mexicana]
MHCITYMIVAFIPSFVFSLAALPVDRPSSLQQFILTLLYIVNLAIPPYYAGTFPLTWGMITSVWTWANGLKMAVWLFCMPQEERQKRPFFGTLFYWRERTVPGTTGATKTTKTTKAAKTAAETKEQAVVAQPKNKKVVEVVEPDDKLKKQKQRDLSVSTTVAKFLRDQFLFDTFDIIITKMDGQQQSIAVFDQAVRMLLFQAPKSSMAWSSIASSFSLCTLFSIYLQLQLQVTYSIFVVVFSLAHWILPFLGIKAQWIRTVEVYLEQASDMPPAFDSPWEATSLRDYWSNRWHQFYNSCFVRLAYLPLRRLCGNVKILRRTIPVWGVFALSGIMHEYFLFCTTGSAVYWHGGAGGWQMLFFMLQPIGIQIGDTVFRPGWPGRLWAIGWMIMLSHLFVIPYFLSSYFEVVQIRILPVVFKSLYTVYRSMISI